MENNNFTKYFDDNNKPIFVGDRLKSEWGYEVIVVKDENGSYSGKLVCDNNHSCKNIPYALNKGKGYNKLNMVHTETRAKSKKIEYLIAEIEELKERLNDR